jgi:hypothetical protein
LLGHGLPAALALAGQVRGEVGRQDSDRVADSDVRQLAALGQGVDGGRRDVQAGGGLADREQIVGPAAKG